MLKPEVDTGLEKIIVRKWADQAVLCLDKHVFLGRLPLLPGSHLGWKFGPLRVTISP